MPRKTPASRRIHSALLAALVSLAASAPAQRTECASPTHYKIVPLPFHPAHINRSGVIVGTTEEGRPVLWTQKDGLREIELPAGFTTAEAPSINQAGDVVGTLKREDSARPYAFKYSGGKLTLLSEDPSKAQAISDSGEIAGQNASRIVSWRRGKSVALGGCCGGTVRGINAHGHIVGQLNDAQGHYGAFLWDGHKIRSIAPSDGIMSSAVAINNDGYVLVQSFGPNAVFLWHGGKFAPIKLAADVANQPLALNNCNVIAGEYGAASDYYHAFLWDEKDAQRDLNTMIDANSTWILESAIDINDSGEIVGMGDHASEQDVGFLLKPDR